MAVMLVGVHTHTHTHTHGNLINEKIISINNALLMINKKIGKKYLPVFFAFLNSY